MTPELRAGPLPAEQWQAFGDLEARAFFDEPFMASLYGDDPLPRWVGAHSPAERGRVEDYSLSIGLWAGDVLVGGAIGSEPGSCRLCADGLDAPEPADESDHITWEFLRNSAVAHATQPPHAWLSKVVVEPALHGLGLGRLLIDAVQAHARGSGGQVLLLECQPHRTSFYRSCGFREVTRYPDPAGPPASLMRVDL
jgi:GNAT superfamily N-acetyltransferase